AAIGDLEAGDDPQERRFSGTGRPQQRQERACRSFDAHVIERGEISEFLADVLDSNAHADTCFGSAAAADSISWRVLRSRKTFSASVTSASSVKSEAR